MKYILVLMLILSSLYSDKVKIKTMACPSVMLLQKAPVDTGDNYLDISMYAIANNCVVLSKDDHIRAVGYNANNSKEIFQKILYEKTGVYLYVKRSAIIIEEEGKKSTWRF